MPDWNLDIPDDVDVPFVCNQNCTLWAIVALMAAERGGVIEYTIDDLRGAAERVEMIDRQDGVTLRPRHA